MKFILQTGGQGTKLWPLSREDFPKQFQNIVNSTSLFSYQVKTLLEAYPASDLYVSTKRRYVELSLEQAPEIPLDNYIVEPDAKMGRGPAEGLVFLTMELEHPDEPFFIVQTDCLRKPEDAYLNMISEMERLVKRDKKFISGGLKANYPILGIDYLQLGDRLETGSKLDIYNVDKFIERNNDYYKTKKLVKDFYVATHSNHSCWYPGLMLQAYKKYRPDWYEKLMEIRKLLEKHENGDKLEKIYSEMDVGSTEEVTRYIFPEGYIVLLPYEWTDIGTWNSVYEFFSSKGENYEKGTVVSVDSKGSIVKSADPEKLIAVLGLDDVVVVDTGDVLFISSKDKADKIKQIHAEIKRKKLDKFL